jgi:DNA-binding GntR family transcriptional regulator
MKLVDPLKEPSDLSEHAYLTLRGEIIQCNLPPGAEFTEVELCKKYRLSRSPVRKALALLIHEGLIAPFRRRGYRVCEISLGLIKQTFELRAVLESFAARAATGRCRMPYLRELNDKFVAAAKKNDMKNSVRLHEMIHMEIYRAANNQILDRVAEQLLAQSARFHFLTTKIAGREAELGELPKNLHETLFVALESGDPEKAAEAATHHVERTQRALISELLSAPTFNNVPIAV